IADREKATASVAAISLTAMVAGEIVGRLASSRLALRFTEPVIIAGGVVVCTAGWALLWVASSSGVAVAGLVVVGVGLGPFYPFGVALALAHSPLAPDRAQGVVQLTNGLFSAPAPFLLGWMGDAWGIHQAFLAIPVVLVVVLVADWAAARASRPRPA
ncbi:MAG: MFS transporter, partial [Bifidobacteriaceae bacterium]|nr:MFS transporter [Bifidobacteriaceae bacterium]